MFNQILIPFPPDAPDTSVASYGVKLADQFDADLLIVSVLDRPQQRDQLRADQEETARAATDPILEQARDRGIFCERIIVEGQAEEEIVALVDETDVDLIVMGTHGRSGVDRMILGSVAESVVRNSPVPVLTVTPEASSTLRLPSPDGGTRR